MVFSPAVRPAACHAVSGERQRQHLRTLDGPTCIVLQPPAQRAGPRPARALQRQRPHIALCRQPAKRRPGNQRRGRPAAAAVRVAALGKRPARGGLMRHGLRPAADLDSKAAARARRHHLHIQAQPVAQARQAHLRIAAIRRHPARRDDAPVVGV